MAKYVNKSFVITLSDGSKKRIRVYGKDEKEANKKLAKKRLEYEMGLLTINGNTIFANWAGTWLTTYKKSKVSDGTYKDISNLIKKYYTANIGNMKMTDIKQIHLQNCINQMEGMSNSRIHKAYIYIRDIMKKALINEVINKDPSMILEKPMGTEGERRALSEHERDVFLQTIPRHRLGAFFGLIYACGLRPAEARALQLSNISIQDQVISITQAIEWQSKDIKEPKSKAGYRDIPIPDWYMPILESIPKTNSVFLFPNTKGQPMDAHRYLKGWKSFLRLMDIEAGAKLYRNKVIVHAIDQLLTPYHLRHTFATTLAENGIDMKTAQYLMGHSDIRMTANIYTHVSKKMMATAQKKLNKKEA